MPVIQIRQWKARENTKQQPNSRLVQVEEEHPILSVRDIKYTTSSSDFFSQENLFGKQNNLVQLTCLKENPVTQKQEDSSTCFMPKTINNQRLQFSVVYQFSLIECSQLFLTSFKNFVPNS